MVGKKGRSGKYIRTERQKIVAIRNLRPRKKGERPNTPQMVKKMLETRFKNGSYKSNSGSFKKGQEAWNGVCDNLKMAKKCRNYTRVNFNKDNECTICGHKKNLVFHHWIYRIPVDKKDFLTLCKDCHNLIHLLFKRIKGGEEIMEDYYNKEEVLLDYKYCYHCKKCMRLYGADERDETYLCPICLGKNKK